MSDTINTAVTPVVTGLRGCARCGNGHEAVVFSPFTHPFVGGDDDVFTHWALCPTNGEPILLRVIDGQ